MNYTQLAWSLAEACNHCLDQSERCAIYVALGSGDTRTAISRLVSAAARQPVRLSPDVAVALRAWWVAHDGSRVTASLSGVLIDLLTMRSAPSPSRIIPRIATERNYLQPSRVRAASPAIALGT
jgi:hypothetical protein